MKETILTRWNDLSVAAKEILRNKEPLKLTNMPQALELLSQISRLTSQDPTQKNLIITYHVSDAIFIQMLLQQANPDLSLKLLLPHQAETNNITNSNIIIAPFSLFLFEDEHCETFSVAEFSTVIFDQKIAPAFISEHLMAADAHKALFNEDNQTALLFTDFQELTDSLQTPKSKNPLETIKPKGEKISLGKTDQKKKVAKAEPTPEEATQKSPKKTVIETATKATVTEKSSNNKDQAEKVDPSAFIAIVARNVQRQYIRDYIREHNLQHVLIVTHNRQSARLLEKYLYRARIRSRVVHEKIDDDTATSLFDRYNDGQFTALILMHRVVEELSEKIKKCDSVIFLDFPTVYSEYADRLNFVQTNFKPQHFISIATENDKVWVQALIEEYPNLNLPLVEVDIKPPKKRQQNQQQKSQDRDKTASQDKSENRESKADSTPQSEREEDSKNNSRDRNNRRNNRQRQDRNDRQNERRDNRQRNNNRRRQDQAANNTQPHDHDHEFGDSQSDFFSANQDEIVNHNRLPFEAGSFEANIARENRRRGRDHFNTPGGIGQSSNGNFLQNITQGLNSNGNSHGNSQSENRRNNNNNNNRHRSRKNNRKK